MVYPNNNKMRLPHFSSSSPYAVFPMEQKAFDKKKGRLRFADSPFASMVWI